MQASSTVSPREEGAAQAVHANGEEQGSGVGRNVQHIADDSSLFNLYSHDNSLQFIFTGVL